MPNIALGTSRARLNELKSQRAGFITAAEDALAKHDTAEYRAQMDKAKGLNAEIDALNDLVTEYDRYDIAHAPKIGTNADAKDMNEMGKMLMAGERIGFSVDVLKRSLVSNALLYSGDLVTPTGGGSELHDGPATQVSTLIDQVRVETFEGLGAWEEGYVKTLPTAYAGKPETVAGSARTESTPVFRKAKMLAHEVNVTSFVDRNISKLSPARYAAKCQELAMKAMRKQINNLIVNGDALATHEMFGFLNAKNTMNEDIFDTYSNVAAIDAATLRHLVFGFGGDEEVSANARLVLSKANLDAFSAIPVSSTDNRDLYEISHSGNTGTIKKGALTVPYTIASAVGANKLAMVDLSQYMLCLFGAMTIRIDDSVKAVEREIAILGDALVGGNLISDKAACIATI